MKCLRILYRFSGLDAIPDVSKAKNLHLSQKYEEASEHFQRSLEIFKNMGREEIEGRK